MGADVDPAPNIEHFHFFIEAFYELSSCRQIGMSFGPIPFTAIAEYARMYEVDDFDEFLYIIRLLDNKYLEKEYAAGNKGSKTPNKTSRR